MHMKEIWVKNKSLVIRIQILSCKGALNNAHVHVLEFCGPIGQVALRGLVLR